jgi:hypothetical protein
VFVSGCEEADDVRTRRQHAWLGSDGPLTRYRRSRLRASAEAMKWKWLKKRNGEAKGP